LQAALGADDRVALLEYVALGEDLVVFVVRGGRVQVVRLAGASAELRRLVPLLRLNVERSAASITNAGTAPRALAANARGVLGRLHSVLLAPAAALLDGCSRLVIVPHGTGHHVPFHALHDGHAYLIESTEVRYAPCASLIEHFTERHRLLPSSSTGLHAALVLACSAGGALPHVGEEGRAVVAALPGRLLEEEQATLENLRAHAGACTVLHLAAHAVFRPDEPLFSSLQLADSRLSTLEVFDLELNCSLVTLSACETALGRAGAGDELIGLSRAFLYAGASSLLLSLWKVEDRSTAALMAEFYRALRTGSSKAGALRQAQLALLRNELADHADLSAPYFWAPFTLIGDGGVL
jgi:CHAT domain-containing protein